MLRVSTGDVLDLISGSTWVGATSAASAGAVTRKGGVAPTHVLPNSSEPRPLCLCNDDTYAIHYLLACEPCLEPLTSLRWILG